jgi:RNA polymerase sigma factor (TIGR02999 family)
VKEVQDEVTGLLLEVSSSGREALDRLIPLVYEELKRVAHNRLRAEGEQQSLNTTALVHEVYLRLVDQTRVKWHDRAHFFAVASTVMRRVLVDQARKKRAAKRGGGSRRVALDATHLSLDQEIDALLALEDALVRLASVDERLCRVVECRFFGGLSEEETAEALGVTGRTVERDWAKAKALLYLELAVP